MFTREWINIAKMHFLFHFDWGMVFNWSSEHCYFFWLSSWARNCLLKSSSTLSSSQLSSQIFKSSSSSLLPDHSTIERNAENVFFRFSFFVVAHDIWRNDLPSSGNSSNSSSSSKQPRCTLSLSADDLLPDHSGKETQFIRKHNTLVNGERVRETICYLLSADDSSWSSFSSIPSWCTLLSLSAIVVSLDDCFFVELFGFNLGNLIASRRMRLICYLRMNAQIF